MSVLCSFFYVVLRILGADTAFSFQVRTISGGQRVRAVWRDHVGPVWRPVPRLRVHELMTFYFPPLLCSGHHHTAAMTSWRARRGRSSSLAPSLFAYPPIPLHLCHLTALRSTHGPASSTSPSLIPRVIVYMYDVCASNSMPWACALPSSLRLSIVSPSVFPSVSLSVSSLSLFSICLCTHPRLACLHASCMCLHGPHVFMPSYLLSRLSCLVVSSMSVVCCSTHSYLICDTSLARLLPSPCCA